MNGSRIAEFQRAVLAYGEDGIWDVALGVILLVIGTVELLAWHPVGVTAVLLVIPLALIAKRLLTAPRLREYETRQLPAGNLGAAVGILLVVTVLEILPLMSLIWLGQTGRLPLWVIDLMPVVGPVTLALLAVVIMVTVGTMVGAPGRYFLYAGATAVGFLALLWPSTPAWAAFILPGALMFVAGLGCVARFMFTHPLLPQELRPRFRF